MEMTFNEKLYGDGVLMGNWFEDQQKFIPHDNSWQTTYNNEYLSHNVCETRKDAEVIRRHNWSKNDDSKFRINVLDHACRTVSAYDIDFNRHPSAKQNRHCLRRFSGMLNSWIPEKIDLPLEECPQNWGMRERKEKEWKAQQLNIWDGVYDTTYNEDYNRKYPIDVYKVHPKSRIDTTGRITCKERLKEKFSFSNQWMNFVTSGCKHKYRLPSAARSQMPEHIIDPCEKNIHANKTSNLVSSDKYHVGQSCSEVLENTCMSECRDLTTYDKSYSKPPFCNMAKNECEAGLEYATKTAVGPKHDSCKHISWHIPLCTA